MVLPEDQLLVHGAAQLFTWERVRQRREVRNRRGFGGVFTRPQAGAYEANRRRRLLGRVGYFAAEGKVTRAGARNSPNRLAVRLQFHLAAQRQRPLRRRRTAPPPARAKNH